MTKPRPEDPSDATMQTHSRLGKSGARLPVALALAFLAASVLARCSSAEKTTARASGTVAAGSQHSVAIHPDGTLWAWGGNHNGQLGDGTATDRTAPVQVGTDTHWASAAAGNFHSLAIKTDGTLWTWGSNASGQLGDGTTTDRTDPVQVGTDTNWASVSGGDSHTIALKTDGTVWGWGWNGFGPLGEASTAPQNTPQLIP